MELFASAVVCAVIGVVGIALFFSKKTSFEHFLIGTEAGIRTGLSLLPTLILLMVAVSMLSASGFIELLSGKLAPICERMGIPSEMLPLLLMRPVSGGASNAMIVALFEKYGADSFVGRAASVLLGSSDTILYVSAVYFGAVGVKKTRHTLPAAFLAMFFCILMSTLICRFFFG